MSQPKYTFENTSKNVSVVGDTKNVANVQIPQGYTTSNYAYGTSAGSGRIIPGGETRTYDNSAIGLIPQQKGQYTTTQNYSTVPQSYITQTIENRYVEPY
jgi:hypothetical protein